MWLEITKSSIVKATSMRTKVTVVEGTSSCCSTNKKKKIELKSQQPWTAVSALLGLISMTQPAHAKIEGLWNVA